MTSIKFEKSVRMFFLTKSQMLEASGEHLKFAYDMYSHVISDYLSHHQRHHILVHRASWFYDFYFFFVSKTQQCFSEISPGALLYVTVRIDDGSLVYRMHGVPVIEFSSTILYRRNFI